VFTRVVNHWVIVQKGQSGLTRFARAGTRRGGSKGDGIEPGSDAELTSTWLKNHSGAIVYADSAEAAYGALALANQVLLTMAG
jgi:hypothetical protein